MVSRTKSSLLCVFNICSRRKMQTTFSEHIDSVLDLGSRSGWFETLVVLCCVLEQDTLSSA